MQRTTPDVLYNNAKCYSIFSFMCMFCRSLFVLLFFFLLDIVLSVLRFTDSDYHFCIFKVFSSHKNGIENIRHWCVVNSEM
jgi:hypothetical protein